MTLSTQDILNLKNAYAGQQYMRDAGEMAPIFRAQDHVIIDFNRINQRDIDFNNINDLKQAEFLYSFEKINHNEKMPLKF